LKTNLSDIQNKDIHKKHCHIVWSFTFIY